MQSIEILDIKEFMQLLLQSNTFDSYEFVSGEIRTDILYTLDGHVNKDFFTEEELCAMSLAEHSYLPWNYARSKIFLLIKGKKTPLSMKIVLRLPDTWIQQEISRHTSSLQAKDIDGIYVNIVFQGKKLNVICGISYKIFTLDKNFEDIFTEYFITLFKSKCITCQ